MQAALQQIVDPTGLCTRFVRQENNAVTENPMKPVVETRRWIRSRKAYVLDFVSWIQYNIHTARFRQVLLIHRQKKYKVTGGSKNLETSAEAKPCGLCLFI
jgi:hypothetical protein